MDISVVVPTYKERDNLPELLKRIGNRDIIIVDDNSQDGTREYLADKPVTFIERKEKGLATACVEGFRHAKNEIIVVMDADLQHPPEMIPELAAEVENGNDIVVAKRVRDNFSLYRKMVSKGANLIGRLLFKELKKVQDTQSGFFAFNRKVLEDSELKPTGYKILIEMLVMCKYNSTAEVPYEFGLRTKGESKLGLKTIFSYLRHLLSLMYRKGKIHKLVKFSIVGAIGALINIGILFLLTELFGFYYLVSGLIAIEITIITNFLLNRIWTFNIRNLFFKRLYRDHLTRIVGVIIKMGVLLTLTEFLGFYYISSMLIGVIAGMFFNFIGNSIWVYNEELEVEV